MPAAFDIEPMFWDTDHLVLLDQSVLPLRQEWLHVHSYTDGAAAIRQMRVRGAPAIGVAAAYTMALAANSIETPTMPAFLDQLDLAAGKIAAARPTAVNLGWAVQRCLDTARECGSPQEARRSILDLAHMLRDTDVQANRIIGRTGALLLPDQGGVLTHCNTGALATAGYGTAVGVIRAGWEMGKHFNVFCTETRPWLQGARLTAWELVQLGIPASLIVDSAAASLMGHGEISAVVVGADRITANGDTANKIGTYSLAVLAQAHEIPFYVAAPFSSIDLSMASGEEIVIEERPEQEVTDFAGQRIAAEGIGVRNPAFDVTPARYITAIITERGTIRPPYEGALRTIAHQQAAGAA
ncbi:MAG: S-methyl-5-thioribose-1-phosphate isomerase [Dehalococcoidia bacterium]